MTTKTVLISGASIAGPALAYWLHRHGLTPTVVERAPALRPGGQPVDLRGAARGVVERMGLMDRVRAVAVHERGVVFVGAAGRPAMRMPAELFGGEGIVAEIEIMRGDLTRVLYEATRDHVEYLFDDRIAGLDQREDGVRVAFQSGVTRTFDVVVGADGVHSAVREFAFGPETDYVHHLGAYTAYFTAPDPGDLGDLRDWFALYNAPGRRNAGIRPESGGTVKAMLSFAAPELSYDRQDTGRQRRILAEAFAGVGWRVPALIDALPDAPDFYFDTICQVRVDRWWRGRAVLLGDAAWCASPLTGLGTSMALVGAYVLAGELASDPGDHEAAFTRYQDELRGFVAECHKLPPRGVNGYLPKSRFGISMRNQSMKMMTVPPMRGMLAKQFAKAGGITLREYAREA